MTEFDLHHGLAVAERVMGADTRLVAILHDAVEDGAASREQIERAVPPQVFTAIDHLTRRPDEPYRDYIERIASATGYAGTLACIVKRADLKTNLDRIDAEHESLRPRYEAALERLARRDTPSGLM